MCAASDSVTTLPPPRVGECSLGEAAGAGLRPLGLDMHALGVGLHMPGKARVVDKVKEMVETAKHDVLDSIFSDPQATPKASSPVSAGAGVVKRGDVLQDGRYTVVRKLGSGTFGCVYCAHDRVSDSFVAIKMQKPGRKYSQVALDEVGLLCTCQAERDRLHSERAHAESEFCAGDYIVELSGHFEHKGPKGSQVCMHLEMLGPSLLDLVKDFSYKGVPIAVVKTIARNVLTGLDFLHRTCGIIHTDVKPENILLSIPRDESMPQADLWGTRKGRRGDADSPAWWREHAIKTHNGWELVNGWSRELYAGGSGFEPRAKLVDLGNACRIDKPFTPDIQTIEYRCPEVILGSGYSTPADMWSVACTVFELLTGEYLFDPKKGQGRVVYDREEDLLALQQELLGAMPIPLACGGKVSHKYFNPDGKMKHIYFLSFWALTDVLVQKYGFDQRVADECADFLLPMLEFDPAKRATAAEMLQHPWLQS